MSEIAKSPVYKFVCCFMSLVLVVGFCPVEEALADEPVPVAAASEGGQAEDQKATDAPSADTAGDAGEAATEPSPEGAGPEGTEQPEAGEGAGSEEGGEAADAATEPTLSGTVHVQDIGWQAQQTSSAAGTPIKLGTEGKAKRLEGIKLTVSGIAGSIEYKTHVQDIGWQDWAKDGSLAGTTGKSKRLEAIQIKLTGQVADQYDVYYRVHAQDYGTLGWARNGQNAGTEGLSKRLESLEVVLVAKGQAFSGYTDGSDAYKQKMISYTAHVQDIGSTTGTRTSLTDSFSIGTTGKNKRLEGFKISLPGADGGITYQAHVQDIGWQSWVSDGAFAGTTGKSKRVEAVKIKLTGAVAGQYDVYYRLHVANIGWLGWAKNGEAAGTSNASIKAEAIQVQLVKKGGSAPGSTAMAYLDNSSTGLTMSCMYGTGGSTSYSSANLGETAGTTGKGLALTGIALSVSSANGVSGGVSYAAHVSDVGWLSDVSNGAQSQSGSHIVQAIKMSLTGDLSKYYDIYYRSHVSNYGWLGWAKNGAYSGSTGLSRNIEAYQVKIVLKGAPAPGSTARSYSDKNGFLGVNLTGDKLAMYNRISGNTSGTQWLIAVNRGTHKVGVFKGSTGSWRLQYYWSCVTGKPSTPTITGTFRTTGYKRAQLSTDSRARYCTQIWGGYYFHTILNSDAELGKSLSHGCIRMSYSTAQWIQNNIGKGTTVVIYN